MKKILITLIMVFTICFSSKTNINATSISDHHLSYEQQITTNILNCQINDLFSSCDDSYLKDKYNCIESKYLVIAIGWLLICLLLKLYFNIRKPKIVETIEFRPPDGMDSIAVGYYIDGNVDDKEIIAMFLYFAQKKNLKIEKRDKDLFFIKINEINDNKTKYAKKLFNMLFYDDQVEINVKNINKIFNGNYTKFILSIINELEKDKSLLSKSSKMIRFLSMITTIGLFILISYQVFNWIGFFFFIALIIFYGIFISSVQLIEGVLVKNKSEKIKNIILFIISLIALIGIVIMNAKLLEVNCLKSIVIYILLSLTMLIVTSIYAFNKEYADIIGRLKGFKNFLLNVELDKFNELVYENPNYYLEIMPYIYAFELSDKFVEYINYRSCDENNWVSVVEDTLAGSEWYFVTKPMLKMIDKILIMNGIRKK